MSVIQNASIPINTNDTYICAIEAMYHWATSSSWDDETQHHSDHSEIVRGLQVSYRDVPNQPVRIKWSHLIISILTAVNTMDKCNPNPHPVFFETTVEMKQDEKLFGFLKIGKPPADGTTTKADQANDSTATAKRDELNVDNTKAAPPQNTHPSKTITDTTESGPINITYQRFGHSAPCTLLFSTALDGIAYAAADDFGDTWTYSTCYDWSKKM
ncbi:MAG: hypothetical protein Q9212_007059, partial [Teloschistes hypoglaucus]